MTAAAPTGLDGDACVDSASRHPAEWPPVTSSELWTRATADRYDAEEAEAFSAAVLGPAVAFLAELAGDGRALEFAIGTGRVGVPLRERGVRVVGIELSEHMAAVLRRKVDEDTLPVVILRRTSRSSASATPHGI
ncbi:hypothetical protein GCM10010274_43580 [Streptomyces lavendofoliae]|uniref:Methyltransferase n=1 Tax=Streptomyces lavendofoliae TaxID=67314 RepID=A0A918M6E2_9ACTN|nr:hypothetical protein GCM10010274_43580 [Streptomyces lavendofoliae]